MFGLIFFSQLLFVFSVSTIIPILPEDFWDDHSSNHDIGDLRNLESELCIPQDTLEDIEWYPNFKDDSISWNDLNNLCWSTEQGFSEVSNETLVEDKSQVSVTNVECNSEALEKKKQRRKLSRNQMERKAMKRTCTHCLTDKTPQWRMGPKGPKTLCNACGVRYKSGRLVAEYRPAASPTFDGLKHSNFHKKIMKRREGTYFRK